MSNVAPVHQLEWEDDIVWDADGSEHEADDGASPPNGQNPSSAPELGRGRVGEAGEPVAGDGLPRGGRTSGH
eukprot:1167796-Prorocentrum_minimum.AAC.1